MILDIKSPVKVSVDPASQTFYVQCVQRVPNTDIELSAELRFDIMAFGQLAGGITELIKSGVVTLHACETNAAH